MMAISRSLIILGCSQRKKRTSRLIAAIDRYDGPVFRVLRKHALVAPETPLDTYILSARFGLIPGNFLIPRYNHQLAHSNRLALRSRVEKQLKQTLDDHQPERLFVSVGSKYWPLIEGPLSREVPSAKLVVATGSIGGRASQLAHWLRPSESEKNGSTLERAPGEAALLGTTVRLNRAEVLREARKAMLAAPVAARRFETWYVAVGNERVAPKWLVSVLFDKPVARFRTGDARRILSLLGVDCIYASHY
jgi:uncharacterized protein DUF6884